MVKRNKLRNYRQKAAFGVDGAITAAATLTAAGINAKATADAAKEQSAAIQASARTQADSMNKQLENNNALQERSLSFTREQNELNRNLQKDIQMNLQLLTGQQNTNEMRNASKIQVKCGGSARRKLRNAGNVPSSYLLQGSNNNLPFTVTDGGDVVPIAQTPEGYDLYEIVGNDHEHYHKTKGGKNKTGVGIKFAGNKVIEGEGNQNTNQGELMLVTPDDAKFISKHSIKGFNPAKAVLNGVHPLDAFNAQENIKNLYGISDDGKSSPVGRNNNTKAYNGLDVVFNNQSLDFISPVTTAVISDLNKARNGKSIKNSRAKKWYGGDPIDLDAVTIKPKKEKEKPHINPIPNNDYDNDIMLGAGINALGNIGGAVINTIGNNIASGYLTRGYNNAANILADAYGKLKGIDLNSINRDDYRAAHAMAAIQAPIVSTGYERSSAERALQRTLANVNRNTLSGAAAQNRSARAEVDYNDRISQVEENADRYRQNIIQGNMERINQVANENANRDTQANNQYANAYLNLLQYNNDIENEKIAGIAQARADAITQSSSALANAKQTNSVALANALTQSGLGFSNAISSNAKLKNQLDMTLLGATLENQVNYYLSHPNAPGKETIMTRLKNSDDPKYKEWYNLLLNK